MNRAPAVPGFDGLVEIGRGGFSVVYRARQERFNRFVAIKVLNIDGSDQRRFERECTALGRLTHVRGVVAVLETATTADGRPCIVMPLMGDTSLADRLAAGERFAPATVVQWGTELGTALEQAHRLGIHHRDVKPENVLIGPTGQPALSDFGIAAIETVENASQTAAALSPPYSPPERFLEAGAVDPVASDVYSLGATLYAMLAGRAPFGTASDGGMVRLLDRIRSEPLPTVDRDDVPEALFRVLERSMAKHPGDRFADVGSFVQALGAPGVLAGPMMPAAARPGPGVDATEGFPATGVPESAVEVTVVRTPQGPVVPVVDAGFTTRRARATGIVAGWVLLVGAILNVVGAGAVVLGPPTAVPPAFRLFSLAFLSMIVAVTVPAVADLFVLGEVADRPADDRRAGLRTGLLASASGTGIVGFLLLGVQVPVRYSATSAAYVLAGCLLIALSRAFVSTGPAVRQFAARGVAYAGAVVAWVAVVLGVELGTGDSFPSLSVVPVLAGALVQLTAAISLASGGGRFRSRAERAK